MSAGWFLAMFIHRLRCFQGVNEGWHLTRLKCLIISKAICFQMSRVNVKKFSVSIFIWCTWKHHHWSWTAAGIIIVPLVSKLSIKQTSKAPGGRSRAIDSWTPSAGLLQLSHNHNLSPNRSMRALLWTWQPCRLTPWLLIRLPMPGTSPTYLSSTAFHFISVSNLSILFLLPPVLHWIKRKLSIIYVATTAQSPTLPLRCSCSSKRASALMCWTIALHNDSKCGGHTQQNSSLCVSQDARSHDGYSSRTHDPGAVWLKTTSEIVPTWSWHWSSWSEWVSEFSCLPTAALIRKP